MQISEALAVTNPFANAKPRVEKKKPTMFRLGAATLARLEEIAVATQSDRTWVLEQLVEWGYARWLKDRAPKSRK